MDITPIPYNCERPGQMPLETAEKGYAVLCMDVFVVRQEGEVEPESLALGADGNSTDGGYLLASFPARLNWGLSPGGESPADGGSELESRFVKEYETRAPFLRFFFLSEEIPSSSSVRSLSRSFLEPVSPASGESTPVGPSGSAQHDPGNIPPQIPDRSRRPPEKRSKDRSANHGRSRLAGATSPVPDVALASRGAAGQDEELHLILRHHSWTSCAIGERSFRSNPPFWLPRPGSSLLRTAPPPFDGGAPVPGPILEVSYPLYRQNMRSSVRIIEINNSLHSIGKSQPPNPNEIPTPKSQRLFHMIRTRYYLALRTQRYAG